MFNLRYSCLRFVLTSVEYTIGNVTTQWHDHAVTFVVMSTPLDASEPLTSDGNRAQSTEHEKGGTCHHAWSREEEINHFGYGRTRFFGNGPCPRRRQPSSRRPSSSTSHRGCRSRPAAGARGRPEAYLCRPLPLAQKLDSTDYSQIYAANSNSRLHHGMHQKDVRI